MVRFLRSFSSPSSLCRRLLISTTIPPFRGRCSSAKLPAGSLFIAWCSPVVVSCFLRLPYVKCRLGAAVLQVQCLFFILLFSSFVPFRRYAPSSRYCSHQAWDLKRGCFFFPFSHSLCCSLLFRSPVHALRYKRYTFFRPRFEGFFPVLPVSFPFSRGSGSVPTLFDSTIYFHFNLFKSPTKLESSRFLRSPFSLGTGLQIRCTYFL